MLVVMSQVAADLLARALRACAARSVHIIPHGIPDMAPRDQDAAQGHASAWPGSRMLLTFGLLGPNKGIETVIRALPGRGRRLSRSRLLRRRARRTRRSSREHGEAYRTTLEREAERLGVREHVVFRDQYVTTEELCSYLQAADVFVSPYLNEAQVTSGALSYAMGAGAAVVSTPYWHAQELLADGRGRLFPFGDSAALGRRRSSRCSTRPAELARVRDAAATSTRARSPGRASARSTCELGADAASARAPARRRRRDAPRASSLPELRLDHLLRMTDDTGIIQHATFSVPARESGYCVDDNARALIVALHADRLNSSAETQAARHDLPRLPARGADRRRAVPELHELRPRVHRAERGVGGLHGPRALGAGRDRHLARDEGQRMLARADVRARRCAVADELGPRGTRADDAGPGGVPDRAPGGRRRAADLLRALARAALPTLPRAGRPRTGAGSSRR